jgi:hypothetical protein
VRCCRKTKNFSQNGRPVKASVKVRKSLEAVSTIAGKDERPAQSLDVEATVLRGGERAWKKDEEGTLSR